MQGYRMNDNNGIDRIETTSTERIGIDTGLKIAWRIFLGLIFAISTMVVIYSFRDWWNVGDWFLYFIIFVLVFAAPSVLLANTLEARRRAAEHYKGIEKGMGLGLASGQGLLARQIGQAMSMYGRTVDRSLRDAQAALPGPATAPPEIRVYEGGNHTANPFEDVEHL